MDNKDALLNAISGHGNLRDAAKVLIESGKQLIDTPATFRTDALSFALKRFLKSEINADDLEQWCDAVEGNDAIDYERGHENDIASLLFELSSPDINGPLTKERCAEILEKLEGR